MGLDMYLHARVQKNDPELLALAEDDRGGYVSGWAHNHPEEIARYEKTLGRLGLDAVVACRDSSPWLTIEKPQTEPEGASAIVSANVAYWRKANQIHSWFVANVQDGEDDCGYYVVTRDQLAELVRVCKLVKASSGLVDGIVRNGKRGARNSETGEIEWVDIFESGKKIDDPTIASELLPAATGFFFGSNDYNEWYYRDVENTILQLEHVLAHAPADVEFVYHSSW